MTSNNVVLLYFHNTGKKLVGIVILNDGANFVTVRITIDQTLFRFFQECAVCLYVCVSVCLCLRQGDEKREIIRKMKREKEKEW